MTEQEQYAAIYWTLVMAGEHECLSEVDGQVHVIMDNPELFPEYFN